MRTTRHAEMARWAGWLFAACGLLAFVAIPMPADGPRSVPAVAALAVADLLVAAAIAVLPARWWDVRRLTRLASVALVLCSLFLLSGAVPPFGYPTFFLVLFAWIGLALPRGTALRLALPAAIAYALPPVLRDAPPALAGSVVVAVPLMVLLAETAAAVVSRLDRLNSALLTAATIDDLTGVGNRRRADELLRGLEPGDAVIMIDIDHFKQVNDRLGHAAGDDVLTRLGGLLREVIRDEDVVARYGGEEFVVVVRGAGGRAVDAARRVVAAWGALGGQPTLSVGVAVHDADATSEETVAAADGALYEAKRAGRDRIHVAAPVAVAVAA
jgi:diguanylate cyclase (GGDEF)-like protein